MVAMTHFIDVVDFVLVKLQAIIMALHWVVVGHASLARSWSPTGEIG